MKSARKPKHGAFAELIASAKMITVIVVLMGLTAAAVIGYILAFADSAPQESSVPPQFSPVCEQSERRYGTEARIGDVGTAPRIIQIDGRNVTVPVGDWAELSRPVSEDFLGIDWNGSGTLEPDSTEFSHIYFLNPQDAQTGSPVDGLVIPAQPGSNIYNALHGTGRSFQKGWKIYRNLERQCWGIDTAGQTFTATTTTTTTTTTIPPTPSSVAIPQSSPRLMSFYSQDIGKTVDGISLLGILAGNQAGTTFLVQNCRPNLTFSNTATAISVHGTLPLSNDRCWTHAGEQLVPSALRVKVEFSDGSDRNYDIRLS